MTVICLKKRSQQHLAGSFLEEVGPARDGGEDTPSICHGELGRGPAQRAGVLRGDAVTVSGGMVTVVPSQISERKPQLHEMTTLVFLDSQARAVN